MKTKQILWTCVLFMFTTLFAKAQDKSVFYFPDRPGAVVELTSYNAKGKVTGTIKHTVVDVKNTSDGRVLTVNVDTHNAKGKEVSSGSYTLRSKDGVFYYNLRNMLDPRVMANFKNAKMEVEGVDMAFPERMTVGQSIPDAKITMHLTLEGMAMPSISISTTNCKVVGQEDITTPAGTFKCYKVTYDCMIDTVLDTEMKVVAWMAKGVGNVLSETYKPSGKLISKVEMTEFHP